VFMRIAELVQAPGETVRQVSSLQLGAA
jgi:hypothetical protein